MISNGLLAASRIVEQHNIAGFYGPLIELIEVDNEYITAVEVTAGNR
jgi:chromosome segregation ATPase